MEALKTMLTSWEPTVVAVVTAFFGFVLLKPAYFSDWLVDVAGYAAIGGLAAFGFVVKQHNVTGGTVVQPSNQEAKIALLNPQAPETSAPIEGENK